MTEAEGITFINNRVAQLMAIGAGCRKRSMDVINEVLTSTGAVVTSATGYTNNPWLKPFGLTEAGLLKATEVACKKAIEIDPSCGRILNEFGIGPDFDQGEGKPAAFKAFAKKLAEKEYEYPAASGKKYRLATGIGCQLHAATAAAYTQAQYEAFIAEYKAINLEVQFTEIAQNLGTGSIGNQEAAWSRLAKGAKEATWLNIWGPEDSDNDTGKAGTEAERIAEKGMPYGSPGHTAKAADVAVLKT